MHWKTKIIKKIRRLYIRIIADLIVTYENMGCDISLKRLFLHFHLHFFRENLGRISVKYSGLF